MRILFALIKFFQTKYQIQKSFFNLKEKINTLTINIFHKLTFNSFKKKINVAHPFSFSRPQSLQMKFLPTKLFSKFNFSNFKNKRKSKLQNFIIFSGNYFPNFLSYEN